MSFAIKNDNKREQETRTRARLVTHTQRVNKQTNHKGRNTSHEEGKIHNETKQKGRGEEKMRTEPS